MQVIIRVWPNQIGFQFSNGLVHYVYDWVMILDLIRDNDIVIVQDYTSNSDFERSVR